MPGSQDLLSFSYSIAGSASTGESLKRAHRSPPEDFRWVMFEMPRSIISNLGSRLDQVLLSTIVSLNHKQYTCTGWHHPAGASQMLLELSGSLCSITLPTYAYVRTLILSSHAAYMTLWRIEIGFRKVGYLKF